MFGFSLYPGMYFLTKVRFFLMIKLPEKLYKKRTSSVICLKYVSTMCQACSGPWRSTNKFPQGIQINVRKTHCDSKQNLVRRDRCCEDLQKCSGSPKEGPTKSSYRNSVPGRLKWSGLHFRKITLITKWERRLGHRLGSISKFC